MRFAIDARPALDPRRTGVGRYAEALIRHLPAAATPDDVVAWYLDPGLLSRRRRFSSSAAPNLHEHPGRLPRRAFAAVSSRLGVPRLEWSVAFDALLATNFLPPATRSRAVVMVVHDLAYEVLPETAPHHDERWRRRFAAWLERAAAVVVPSTSTRGDLLSRHAVDPSQVHVIAHGVEPFAAPDAGTMEHVRHRYGIGGPYALFVGAIEPRKNLPVLVEAFAALGRPDAWLVIAGGRAAWHPCAADELRSAVARLGEPARRRVVLTGYVDDAERLALLAGATAFAYPSRYEGFGFPVLESFAAGVPVLTSTSSSLPEVAGSAAILVDPDDAGGIAEALGSLFEDADLRSRLGAAGRERARAFTWSATASATADVLRAAAARATPEPRRRVPEG